MKNLRPIYIKEEVIKAVREFFAGQNFHEMITPVLNKSLPLEPNLYPFKTVWDRAGKREDFYLSTSPEAALKKMIANGMGDCFAVGHSFRNMEGSGRQHNPEFLMLEWYRENADYRKIMEDVRELVIFIKKRIDRYLMSSAGLSLNYQGKSADLGGEWKVFSLVELFKKYAGMDLIKLAGPVGRFPPASAHDLRAVGRPSSLTTRFTVKSSDDLLIIQAKRKGYKVDGANWEQLFNQIFLNEIEPELPKTPFFLTDFPARISPLCAVKKENPEIAERFEFYLFGMELGNGNTENTDSKSVKKHMEEEKKIREKNKRIMAPIDREFLKALEAMSGKKYAGIGLGIDRLAMIFADEDDINSFT